MSLSHSVELIGFDNDSNAKITKKNYIMRNGKKLYKTDSKYVYRTEDNTYFYRLYHKETHTNTYITKDSNGYPFVSESVCYNALIVNLHQLDNHLLDKKNNITFNDVWELFLKDNTKGELTLRKYNSIYKYHVKNSIGHFPIIKITVGDYNGLLARLYMYGDGNGNKLHGYSYSFVMSILKYFYLVISYAYSINVVSSDYYVRFQNELKMPIKTKRNDNKEIRILTNNEICSINELLKNTDLYIPFIVSLLCGTRPAETFALCWSDINFNNNTISINKQIVDVNGRLVLKEPKNITSNRTITMSLALSSILKNRYNFIKKQYELNTLLFEQNIGKCISGFNFQESIIDMPDFICRDSINGKYMSYSSFQYYAKIIRRDICLNNDIYEDFSFYTFRKTHLSLMAANNCPVGELMKRAGHSKIETIYKYYFNSSVDSQNALNTSLAKVSNIISF